MKDQILRTIIMEAIKRALIVYDSNAEKGEFTIRLITLLKNVMRTRSVHQHEPNSLTDLFVPLAAVESLQELREENLVWLDAVSCRESLFDFHHKKSFRFLDVDIHVIHSLDGNLNDIENSGELYKFALENEKKFLHNMSVLVGGDKFFCVGLDRRALINSEQCVIIGSF